LGWKDSKVGRKRRKKIDFDLTLLEGKEKRGGIGLGPVGSKSKKKREYRTIRSHAKDTTDIVLIGGKEAKKLMREFNSPAVLAHDRKNERRLDLAHPILFMCQNCGFEGLQSEWVKRGESKQSKPQLTCPRCGSSEHRETA